MQVQAGELFARLVTDHGYSPQLRVIRGHNHLTQVYAVNTGDESLSAPLLEFLRAVGVGRAAMRMSQAIVAMLPLLLRQPHSGAAALPCPIQSSQEQGVAGCQSVTGVPGRCPHRSSCVRSMTSSPRSGAACSATE